MYMEDFHIFSASITIRIEKFEVDTVRSSQNFLFHIKIVINIIVDPSQYLLRQSCEMSCMSVMTSRNY
jgi:hypothetical protein